ncbi:hypothetical protein ACQEVB_11090 [Pseudonocardia sp. CA-107938]|uniref:hypothetical protein n=1 Tax=Pseudonocardia sp. CA-107938 TaxID=3240021 RepID=UPI003D8D8204
MPPTNRRTAGIRRPRVAGRTQREASTATEVLEPPVARRTTGGSGRTATIEAPVLDDALLDVAETDDVETATATETVERPADEGSSVSLSKPARPKGRRAVQAAREETTTAVEAPPRPSRLRALAAAPATTRALIVWGAVAVVLALLASVFGAMWFNREHNGPAANHALIDVGATSLVAQQVGEAVKTIYSYDFARLDENEKNARAVITPEFEQQFTQLFGEVRARAPQQKAVVTATVALTGVRELSDDTAVLVIFMNQIATRTAENGPAQQLASAGRLTVTAKKVDGTWKVADVQAV